MAVSMNKTVRSELSRGLHWCPFVWLLDKAKRQNSGVSCVPLRHYTKGELCSRLGSERKVFAPRPWSWLAASIFGGIDGDRLLKFLQLRLESFGPNI